MARQAALVRSARRPVQTGRLISASINGTRAPPCARAIAMFAATIGWPWRGCALVPSSTFVPVAVYFDTSEGRSARNDSPKWIGTCGGGSSGCLSPRTDGTSPRNGSLRRSWMSSGVLIVSFMKSKPNATATAVANPSTNDMSHVRRPAGDIGRLGISARSMMRTLFARLALATRSSFSCCSNVSHRVVALRFALHHVVVDALALIRDVRFRRLDILREGLLGELRRVEFGLDLLNGARDFEVELVLGPIEGAGVGGHLRKSRTVALEQLRTLLLQSGQLAPGRDDLRVCTQPITSGEVPVEIDLPCS